MRGGYNDSSTSSEEETYVPDDKKLVNPTLVSRRSNMSERAKYIPLRLTPKDRKKLHLLEATLAVSQYTDKVDIRDTSGALKVLRTQIKDICAVLCGLLISEDYEEGQRLLKDKDFAKDKEFFQKMFEIGRRHKIMNPEKMRSEYGKMIYLLQDSISPKVQEHLGFNIKMGIKTVYDYLEQLGAIGILEDEKILIATQEIIQKSGQSRHDLQREIHIKEKTVKELCKKYCNNKADTEKLLFCLYSLTDNNSFLNSNAEPIYKMLNFLTTFFASTQWEQGYDLAITAGMNGARLSHSHENQYNYVFQSLTLWADIMDNMFMLWFLAENDLLNEENAYTLKDTGQGLQRVQNSPLVHRAMQAILDDVKKRVDVWVGSSVIHLGDHNVPNSLMFIDKYTQVPRILVPIVRTIDAIDEIIKNPPTKSYIDKAFGGADKVKKDILVDFFRYGFDGSGADNFIDAGSCIDGRLTSAWNWCSQLEKKDYFSVFLLCGFIGFDGDFQK